VQRRLSVQQHGVAVPEMSVDKLGLEVGGVGGRGRDEQRLGHGLPLKRVPLGDEDALAILVLDADGA
jgi:hypothetical protein